MTHNVRRPLFHAAIRISNQVRFTSSALLSSPPPPPHQNASSLTAMEQCIGNTRLIRLKGPSEATGCHIWGKAEYENPGGSIKDRAALSIILDAERKGILVPGEAGVIVEGTAGNTGIGLALVGMAKGYNCVIVIGSNQSEEKKALLRYSGAQLVEVDPVPFKNPNNYVHVAERMAKAIQDDGSLGRVLYADQWSNLANREAHSSGTGPEIWQQLEGNLDAFSCAMGTGGTLTGVAEFLREQTSPKRPLIYHTDPCGAALHRFYTTGVLQSEGTSLSEGIGQGRITGNMEGFVPDKSFEISDEEMLPWLYRLQRDEGLALGGSAGINVAGAVRVAKDLGPGHTIATVLCDRADRYAGKLYNLAFLKERNLPVPEWLDDAAESGKAGLSEGQRKAIKLALEQAMV